MSFMEPKGLSKLTILEGIKMTEYHEINLGEEFEKSVKDLEASITEAFMNNFRDMSAEIAVKDFQAMMQVFRLLDNFTELVKSQCVMMDKVLDKCLKD